MTAAQVARVALLLELVRAALGGLERVAQRTALREQLRMLGVSAPTRLAAPLHLPAQVLDRGPHTTRDAFAHVNNASTIYNESRSPVLESE